MALNSTPDGQKIHSVTTLNRLARNILTSEIGLIWLSAEISNLTKASSGHWYFTLKDDRAQVRAAMFRSANRVVRTPLKEGDRVLVRASVGIYEPRGDYQLVVETLQPEGEGQLKQAFEQLKYKLQSEGLFDTSRKQPLPRTITRIGIITSAQGAALHDVLSVLKRRSPATEVIVYPSLVQGELAAAQLARCLWLANQRREVDVLLLTRGGGSLEDLWCFNDETLARAIVDSALPVVSAVGHEIDVTIADFVADLRAPTPSAAAELLSMDISEINRRLIQLTGRLGTSYKRQVQGAKHELAILKQRLTARHPSVMLQQQSQRLDQLSQQLSYALNNKLQSQVNRLQTVQHKLAKQHPERRLTVFRSDTRYLHQRLTKQMCQRLETEKLKLGTLAHLLQSVSPLATMARGYSITLHEKRTVTSIKQVAQHAEITSRVADGEITSVVSGVKAIPKVEPHS